MIDTLIGWYLKYLRLNISYKIWVAIPVALWIVAILSLSGCGALDPDEYAKEMEKELEEFSNQMNDCSARFNEPCVLIAAPVSKVALLEYYFK